MTPTMDSPSKLSTDLVSKEQQHQLCLDELLSMLRKEPEDFGVKLLCSHEEKSNTDSTFPSSDDSLHELTSLLRQTSMELFQQIETLYKSYSALQDGRDKQTKKNDIDIITTLSGLPQLYVSTGPIENHNNNSTTTIDTPHVNDYDNNIDYFDAETIWGQVELQNNALHKIVKRSLRQLLESDNQSAIRLLHDDHVDDDDYNENEGDNDDNNDSEEEEDDEEENDNGDVIHENSQVDDGDDDDDGDGDDDNDDDTTDDEHLDEDTKRIRNRMKRTMDEMSDDEDDDEDEENEEQSMSKPKSERGVTKTKANVSDDDVDDIENDPTTVQLHDGFFNLQEMEDFADEEEEFLPNDAYGPITTETNVKNLDQRSFHQKQRDGDMIDHTNDDSDPDDENDDDEDEGILFGAKDDPIVQRRKKYRDDEDIEALYQLYNTPQTDDDDDDIIHMTAADVFGQPNRKYYNQWTQKQKSKNKNDFVDDDDYDDNMNDFNSTDRNKKSGWNDKEDGDEGENDDSENDDDHDEPDQDDESNLDDEIPMKDEILDSKSKSPLKTGKSKLLEQTEQLERDILAEKPWQMKGETVSSARPVNSLLDCTPEFEVATKVNPIITIAHTANLEDIIKQRIVAEDWDDVIPRELPDVGWYKKKGELPEVSQEKSKLGLGELYEREYLKKAVGYDVDVAEKLSGEDKIKNELKSMFANVCSKLDALSNYHFTPRPVSGDTEVRPITVPAIAMEEVLPIHVSDARGVAPEEVYGSNKRGRDAILRDASELDQQDKKRIRNSKKTARRKERRAKLADEKLISRLEPSLGLNNPYEKRKIREELSMARAGGRVTMGTADTNDKYGTSHTFFQRLQKEAEDTIRNDGKTVTGNVGSLSKNTKSTRSSALKL
jgi:U3 small nucleolar RNA-associated protein MPP10